MNENTFVDIRSLSGTMAKILLVYLFERGGMTIEELAYRTGVRDLKTLRLACKDMSRPEMGLLVTQTGPHGREMWLPAGSLLPEMRQGYFPERGNPPLCLDVAENQNGGFPRSGGAKQSGLLLENDPERGIPPTCAEKLDQNGGFPRSETGSIMMIDDESLIKNQESSIINPGEEIPSCETLLESAALLFGSTLDPTDIPPKTPAPLLLAWIVKVYDDRKRLSNPLGLLRSRMTTKAPRSLPKNWQERLPSAYLIAIGILQPQATSSAESEFGADERNEPNEDDQAQINPILDQRRHNGEGMSINQAWESVLAQMRLSMPRSSYENFVSKTMPIDWSEETGRLTVAARNDYARDWLENRLQSTCLRLLAGMLNRSVELRFVARVRGEA